MKIDRKYYFIAAFVILLIEVLIAIFVHDNFVRPYIGDVLVVMLIYCFIRSFVNASVGKTALFVLLFAFGIEILQYFNIVTKLGLQHSKVARIVIGTSYEWIDFITYTIGIIIVLVVENLRQRNTGKNQKP